jgi:hypothetical protein
VIHFRSRHRHHGAELAVTAYDGDQELAEVTLPEPATFEDVVAELQKAVAGRAMVRGLVEGE